MRGRKGNLYLLTGIIIGFSLGLAIAWIYLPVEYTDTSPASLEASYKDQYRVLIASAYAADNDLVRAKARLELLEDEDALHALTEQAQRALATGKSPEEARALSLLAQALLQAVSGQTPPINTLPVYSTNPAMPATQSSPTIQTTP